MDEKLNGLIGVDIPDRGLVTKESIKTSSEQSYQVRSDVRIAMGRVWTTEKYEARRKRVLLTPLP